MAKGEETKRPHASLKAWLGNWQEWGSLILLVLTLGIAVRSIEVSQWISPQPALILILCLSILTCLVMVKSRLPTAATLPLNIVIGAVVMAWQALNLVPIWATWGANSLISSLRWLLQAIGSGKPSENTIFFAVFIIICVWVIGYISTWFVLRRQNAWVAAFLGATAILVNLDNLSEESYGSFFYYLVAAMMLMAFVGLARRHFFFGRLRVKYPKRAVASFMASALCLSLIMISVAWFAPEIRASELETLVSTKMPKSKDIENYWMNLFAAVPAKLTLIRSSHQQVLSFSAPLNLSQDIQFVIASARQPSYWRTRRFDVYNAWGWSSSKTLEQMLSSSTSINASDSSGSRSELTYTVVNKVKTDVMLTAGELVSVNIQTLFYSLLPAGSGKETQNNSRAIATQTQGSGNIMAITAARFLKPNESYQANAIINSATPAELTRAGQNYPRSVTDFYLQLPSSLPQRVRQTSQLITMRAQAQTPYGKAMAIKTYLSQLTYFEAGIAPPEGIDGVDYFLSIVKTGNCTNFASAMVVMLRSVGVPARFATGYLPREWDENTKTANIRAKDYHAWPEVYFPGFGWIEFEATPLPDRDSAGGGVDDSAEDISEESLSAADAAPTERSWTGLSLTILGTLLFLFILVSVVRRRLRHLTAAQYASEMYARMCFYASLLRFRPRLGQTPLEYSRELVATFQAQAESIGNITQAYIKTTFSQRKELEAEARKGLSQSWRILSRAFLKRMFHIGR